MTCNYTVHPLCKIVFTVWRTFLGFRCWGGKTRQLLICYASCLGTLCPDFFCWVHGKSCKKLLMLEEINVICEFTKAFINDKATNLLELSEFHLSFQWSALLLYCTQTGEGGPWFSIFWGVQEMLNLSPHHKFSVNQGIALVLVKHFCISLGSY